MSTNATIRLDFEQAEELARRLATAVSARRIYAPDHSRTLNALKDFLELLHGLLGSEAERLRLTTTGGILTHEGVPMGTEGHAAQLANLLYERDCGGLELRASVKPATVGVLVEWLAGRRPSAFAPNGEGLELLEPGAGEELTEDERTGRVQRFPEFELPKQVLESSIEVLGHIMADTRAGRSMDLREIADLTELACEAARAEGVRLFAATQIPRTNPQPTDHAINVFLTATTLLQPFARDQKELKAFSQAALLHDIGKSWVPAEVLAKHPDELSEFEKAQLERHPELGAQILAQMPNVDALAVEVAYCHHMTDDGKGFPKPIMPVSPGPVTSMVQVGDLFESVSGQRQREEDLGTLQAVNCILERQDVKSKRKALALLLHRLTDAPPGAEVTLESGQRGIVVEVFADAPSHPRVRITREADGARVRAPYVVDLRDAGPDAEPVTAVRLKPEP